MTENEIAYKIRGSIFNVYNELGPGLLESVYESALLIDLNEQGMLVSSQVHIPAFFHGIKLTTGFRADLVVENKVIVEIKSVEALAILHHKQLLTYLKVANLKLGILVNFNSEEINLSIFRKVNGL